MNAMYKLAPYRNEARQKHRVALRQAKTQSNFNDISCHTGVMLPCSGTKRIVAYTLITMLIASTQAARTSTGYSDYQQEVNPSLKSPSNGYSDYQKEVNPSLK